MDKIVLGIYVDGLSIYAALVSQSHGMYRIEQLDSFKLFNSLETSNGDNNDDAFARKSDRNLDSSDSENPFGRQ